MAYLAYSGDGADDDDEAAAGAGDVAHDGGGGFVCLTVCATEVLFDSHVFVVRQHYSSGGSGTTGQSMNITRL